MHFDALPLEYKLQERRSLRNGNVLDLGNDPLAESKACVLGLGLKKERVDLRALQRSLVVDYSPYFR